MSLLSEVFQSQKRKEAEVDRDAKSMIDLLGYRYCSTDGILTKKDGTFARYLRVGSTDLFNIDMDGLLAWINGFAVSERIYTHPHKLIAVTARVDTSANQLYWQTQAQALNRNKPDRSGLSKREQQRLAYQDQQRLRLIKENQAKSASIEQDTKDYVERIYAIQIYGKTVKQLKQRTRDLILSNGNIYGMRTMDRKETEELQERLYNMNSR